MVAQDAAGHAHAGIHRGTQVGGEERMTKAKKPVKASSSKAALDLRCTLFAEAYLANGGNKTQAAIAAGCPEKGAAAQGIRLYNHDKVQALIAERTAKTISDLQITTERILKERARLAFFNPKKLRGPDGRPLAIHELDDDTAAAIAGIEMDEFGAVKKIRMADKNASLTALEKFKGMIGPDQVPQESQNRQPMDMIEAARVVAFALAAGAKAMELANKAKNPSLSSGSGLVLDQPKG